MYSVLLALAMTSTDPLYVERHVVRGHGCAGATAAGCHGSYHIRQVTRIRHRSHGCAGGSGCQGAAPALAPMPSAKPTRSSQLGGGECLVMGQNCPCTTNGGVCDCQGCACDTTALAQVNQMRQARGLRPYVQDDGLVRGALAAAVYRARNRIHGHTPNDFAYLPAGTSARAGGCAVRGQGDNFAACCIYDDYTFAGAATVTGDDGQVYCQLFVR